MLKELSDVEVLRIQKAEAEMAACENCAGECQKLCPDYCVPRIRSVMGHLDIAIDRCQYFKPREVSEVVHEFKPAMHELFGKIPPSALNLKKQIEAEWQAKRESNRARVLKQYGLSTINDEHLNAIIIAEESDAQCKECNGVNCRKVRDGERYQRHSINGVEVEQVECEVGQRLRLEEERDRRKMCLIPAKYHDATFKDYELNDDNARAGKMAAWFVATYPARWLYFYGECGTGKTFLASIIAQEFLRRKKRVVFGDVPSLLEAIKRTFKGGGEDLLERYCNCDLLILDDLGAGQVTEWSVGVLYQIINDRYNEGKRVIVTSNFDLDKLERRLKGADDFSATRIISRLSEMCEVGFLGTTDRRKKSW